jgi:hypothetical protein
MSFALIRDAVRRTPHAVASDAAEHRARGGADNAEGDDACVLAKKSNLNPSFEHALGIRSNRKGR